MTDKNIVELYSEVWDRLAEAERECVLRMVEPDDDKRSVISTVTAAQLVEASEQMRDMIFQAMRLLSHLSGRATFISMDTKARWNKQLIEQIEKEQRRLIVDTMSEAAAA